MTSPICATLSGNLSGNTKQGSLTTIPIAYALTAQEGHQQLSGTVAVGETKVVAIPTNLAGPNASPAPLTMLLVTLDVGGIEVILNSGGVPVGPFQYPKPAGPLSLPGQVGAAPGVPVADVSFQNLGSQVATFSITAIYGN